MNGWTSSLTTASKKLGVSVASKVSKVGEVFGQSLSKVLQYDRTDIPVIVTNCTSFIETNGLDSPGVFRLSGSQEKVQEYKEAYDRRKPLYLFSIQIYPHLFQKDEYIDFNKVGAAVDDITGLLKLYIRELPEPITTFALYTPLLENKDSKKSVPILVLFLNNKKKRCFCNKELVVDNAQGKLPFPQAPHGISWASCGEQ